LIEEKFHQLKIFTVNTNIVYQLEKEENIPALESINLFNFKYVFFPNCRQDHYTLLVLDTVKKIITFYDSLLSNEPPEYLVRFIKNHYQKLFNSSFEDDWSIEIKLNIPNQTDGHSCGVFICQYARCIAAEKSFDFDQVV
jgi:sentrin-specific protease 1